MAVDKCASHAEGLGADAIEFVAGDKKNALALHAEDLLGRRVGASVRLKITDFLHGNGLVHLKTDMLLGRFQHVPVSVR